MRTGGLIPIDVVVSRLVTIVCLSIVLLNTPVHGRFADSHPAVRRFFGHNAILRSIPAINLQGKNLRQSTTEVSTKVSKRVQRVASDISAPLSGAGLYYGVSPNSMERHAGSNRPKTPKPKRIRDTMEDTLEELRRLRLEMEALRKEIHVMQEQTTTSEIPQPFGTDRGLDGTQREDSASLLMKRRNRQREFESLSLEIEKWAKELLFDQAGEENGWTEVKCNKMFQNMNRNERTKTYLKWMKDSRGKYATPDDQRDYPCIKIYSTIDAPVEEVGLYLSQAQNKDDYNDLIDRYKDLEEITPHSKICWGQTPQILFLKPRDFVTFCSHRWLRDGTQVMVNQACKDETGTINTDRPMAYALRGANFISRHPDDPEKTRICMLSHGNPGSDVPTWAVKTAVNSLAPIEPFKLFHRINQGIANCREELEQKSRRLDETEMVSSGGVSRRPAGLAQLGYACFWPDGGGIQEGGAAAVRMQSTTRQITDEPYNESANVSPDASADESDVDKDARDSDYQNFAEEDGVKSSDSFNIKSPGSSVVEAEQQVPVAAH